MSTIKQNDGSPNGACLGWLHSELKVEVDRITPTTMPSIWEASVSCTRIEVRVSFAGCSSTVPDFR